MKGFKKYMTLVFLVLSLVVLSLVLSACRAAGNPPSAPSSPPPSTTGIPGGMTSIMTPSVSNGQRIYDNSSSNSGIPITYSGGPGMMVGAAMACATCHGPQGHGGTLNFMMQTFTVPNITWPVLSGPDPDMEHPAYTEETLKQAITQGVDPGGSSLDYPMPRWQMSAQDLNDLIAFIKTLK
jgi:cytochrome c oxidase subunit 2